MLIFGKRGEASWSLRPEGGGMIQGAPLAECHRLAEERGEGTTHLFADQDGAHTRALPLLLRPSEASGDGA